MDSRKKTTAQTACLSGMAVLLMVKPLSNGTHPAGLLAVGVVGVIMLVYGVVMFSRLATDQEKTIEELRKQLGTTTGDE